jgi:hypothetical protein
VIGPSGCRQVALSAEATALAEELPSRNSMRLLMQLICVLGSEFTTDPQLPWAREILSYTVGRNETERTRLLQCRTLAYLDEVQGPRNRHGIRALHQMVSIDDREFREVVGARVNGFAALAARTFPEKNEYVGGATLHALYARAESEAGELELGPEGTTLLAALAFSLGSGATRDPCYPWIRRTLRGPGYGHGPRRTFRLTRRTKIYVRGVLSHLAPTSEDNAQE